MPPVVTVIPQSETEQIEASVVDGEKDPGLTKPKPFSSRVGIIYPPPEIRNIVDKTASFVARNGPEFEARIKQNEANNPKFHFLQQGDPYNSYYQHKINEYREGKAVEPSVPKPKIEIPAKIQEAVKAAEQKVVLTDPPPQFEFMAEATSINALDLDIVKLTAMFVARNGRSFLRQLESRESRNAQFDFLKPEHSMYHYFVKLIEQYTKVLIPPKDIIKLLRHEAGDPKLVKAELKYRMEWEKHQRQEREREEAEREKERVAYAQIDWHDFVVVQTVDFQPNEQLNLPPPCTPKDVGARVLAQQRVITEGTSAQNKPTGTAEEMEVESEGEEESDEEKEPEKEEPEKSTKPTIGPVVPNIQPVRPEEVEVRRYDPKASIDSTKYKEGTNWIISPLTGEKIPADKLSEHVRFNTVDPQYFQQKEREREEKQDEDHVFAPGTDISANIKEFAARRTDIFGKGSEELGIGRKVGEEERRVDPKTIWDGHQSTKEATAKAATSNISIEQQIAQIHKQQGLIPDEKKDKIGPKPGDKRPAPPPPPVAPAPAPAPPRSTFHPRPPINVPPVSSMGRAPILYRNAVPMMPPMAAVIPAAAPMMLVQQQPMAVVPPGPPHPDMGPPMIPPGHPAGPFPAMPQMQRPQAPPQEMRDEAPPNKKLKTEESLIPEEEFLRDHTVPVNIKIAVPSQPDKPEWALKGQTHSFTFQLTDTISAIKAKIQECTKMPASKQKLVHEGLFIKDSNTLAYYNMTEGCLVQLQLKERGGRKR